MVLRLIKHIGQNLSLWSLGRVISHVLIALWGLVKPSSQSVSGFL